MEAVVLWFDIEFHKSCEWRNIKTSRDRAEAHGGTKKDSTLIIY